MDCGVQSHPVTSHALNRSPSDYSHRQRSPLVGAIWILFKYPFPRLALKHAVIDGDCVDWLRIKDFFPEGHFFFFFPQRFALALCDRLTARS